MFRGIIIDDEANSAELLRLLIAENCPAITVAATETSAEKGIALIDQLQPDVVFLDIEMPAMSGFQLLEKLKHTNFRVIFITAYDHYAIQAIKYNAFDYLLKPVLVEELISTVNKLADELRKKQPAPGIEKLLEKLRASQTQGKLAVNSQNEVIYVEMNRIIRLEADSNYTSIVLSDKKIVSSKTLKDYESLLNPSVFFRTHKAHLVNLDQVEKFVKSDGGYLVMKDNEQVPVSRDRRQLLLDLLASR